MQTKRRGNRKVMEKLYTKFNTEMVPAMKKELALSNIWQVPKIEKVVVSSGIGEYKEDSGMVDKATNIIAKITGLKPKVNKSRKAVSAFKLRIGQPVGLTVTLRGEKAYDFIDRLVNISIPRIRDFRGLKLTAFDKTGNYSIGIKDSSIFPEIKMEEALNAFGLQINIKSTSKDPAKTLVMLKKLGFPFQKENHGA
jgi:large subunit ribosomal protein L5